MSVEEVRDVITPFASLTPLEDAKYCIISFDTANRFSQNALLKVVEDAPGNTHFFFCAESQGAVLPTLRSRCVVIRSERSSKKQDRDDAEQFLSETYATRLLTVEKMVSVVSKTQDRGEVRSFVRDLLTLAHDQKMPRTALEDLLSADDYMKRSGSSVKIILGHLAATLPRTS